MSEKKIATWAFVLLGALDIVAIGVIACLGQPIPPILPEMLPLAFGALAIVAGLSNGVKKINENNKSG